MMKINELLTVLNDITPFEMAESWDNVGLIVGDSNEEVKGITVTLDVTLEVIDEVVEQGHNTIIAHHPILFSKRQNITNDYESQMIKKLIKHDIQLIALHTNLDKFNQGVSHMMMKQLNIDSTEVLAKETKDYYKLRIFVPNESVRDVESKLSSYGIGSQGNYSECFYKLQGEGQFRPTAAANPHIGKAGELTTVNEVVIETMVNDIPKEKIEAIVHEIHPYEEPVFDLYRLNKQEDYGIGIIHEFENAKDIEEFVQDVKIAFNLPFIDVVASSNSVKKIALIGGSGSPYFDVCRQNGVDTLLTGDIKYHEAQFAEQIGLNVLDIKHYSESFFKGYFKGYLEEQISQLNESNQSNHSIEIKESLINTNPFKVL